MPAALGTRHHAPALRPGTTRQRFGPAPRASASARHQAPATDAPQVSELLGAIAAARRRLADFAGRMSSSQETRLVDVLFLDLALQQVTRAPAAHSPQPAACSPQRIRCP
jgi:hypothetical protein